MKVFFLLIVAVSGIPASGQKIIVDEFRLKEQAYYTELNRYKKDSIWEFNHTTSYDTPKSQDEEWSVRLYLKVRDTCAFLAKKSFDVSKDSSVVKCQFYLWTAWHVIPCTVSIRGTITLLTIEENSIKLKFNVEIENAVKNWIYVYRGDRIFERSTTVMKLFHD